MQNLNHIHPKAMNTKKKKKKKKPGILQCTPRWEHVGRRLATIRT